MPSTQPCPDAATLFRCCFFYQDLPSPYYKESHYKLRDAIRAWVDENLMDVPYEWEEVTKVVDPAVYKRMGDDGILTVLGFRTKIPKKWAKPDGTVFGGVKAEEWDGLYVPPPVRPLRSPFARVSDSLFSLSAATMRS